jgi:signal transduction histidine kinase
MVTMDLAKTKTEIPPGLPDGSGYEHPPRTRDLRGDHTRAPAQPFSTGRSPAAGPDAGAFRRPAGAGPSAADYQFPQAAVGPAGPAAVPGGTGGKHVRSRLRLLILVPAIAVAVVAGGVAALISVLQAGQGNAAAGSVSVTRVLLAIVLGIVMIVVVVGAVRISTATARSVLRSLYGVRARALALAGGRLRAEEPADTASPDEFGDIARALEQLRAEMWRLSGNDTGQRGKLESMFVNLSHRGQSLAERQMRLIGSLEQTEPDRDRRAMLFRANRIAARMHRDSQNLLLLAGHELNSGWNQPVPLASVIRAAVSEVEESERISVLAQPEIAVAGPAVDDVVHLLAELAQNATSFSAVDMSVEISGRTLSSGGVLIDITDRGVGMNPQEIAQANWQLENPPVDDIDVPKWIGFSVVARLAARRGIRMRLNQAEFGGLTALVWLPDDILVHAVAAASAGFSSPGGTGLSQGMRGSAPGPGSATGQRAMPSGRRVTPEGSLHEESPLPGFAGARPGSQPMFQASQAPSAERYGAGPHSALGRPAPDASAFVNRRETAVHDTVGAGDVVVASPVRPGPPPVPDSLPSDGRTAPFASAPPSAVAPPRETGAGDTVIVPMTGNPPEERRLPIFDSVESSWFSGSRRTPDSSSDAAASGNRWSSPADGEWQRTAQTADSPVTGAPTAAGLPQRLPSANLLPGAIPDAQPAALPSRSPAEARDRLSRLQRGAAEGRIAESGGFRPPGEDQA